MINLSSFIYNLGFVVSDIICMHCASMLYEDWRTLFFNEVSDIYNIEGIEKRQRNTKDVNLTSHLQMSATKTIELTKNKEESATKQKS